MEILGLQSQLSHGTMENVLVWDEAQCTLVTIGFCSSSDIHYRYQPTFFDIKQHQNLNKLTTTLASFHIPIHINCSLIRPTVFLNPMCPDVGSM